MLSLKVGFTPMTVFDPLLTARQSRAPHQHHPPRPRPDSSPYPGGIVSRKQSLPGPVTATPPKRRENRRLNSLLILHLSVERMLLNHIDGKFNPELSCLNMAALEAQEITQLLLAWRAGDAAALDRLAPIVYDELSQIARRHMARQPTQHSLQPTALVTEACLRLVDCSRMQSRDSAHSFAMVSQLMRRILIDHARQHNAGLSRISLEEAVEIGIDDALQVSEIAVIRDCNLAKAWLFRELSQRDAGRQ